MSRRDLFIACLLLFLGGALATGSGVALIWDGAYQLCCTLESGVPFAYLSRFHSWVVWHPVAWAASWTHHASVLQALYAAPYCFAPLINVLLSWWVVQRREPTLVIWAIFGAALAPLPGQVFMINDSIFQMHLFWPVFFAALLPARGWQAGVVGILSLFQLSHPIGIALCSILSAGTAVLTFRQPGSDRVIRRVWALWLLALAMGGIAKLIIWPDSYAAREASAGQAWLTFRWGVLWWPLAGMLGAWLCAGLLLLRPQGSRERLSAWSWVALLIPAGCWLYWASQMEIWQTAANYRRWLVPMSFPFLLAAGWEIWARRDTVAGQGTPFFQGRGRAAIAAGAIFLGVLGLQAWQWRGLCERLRGQIASASSAWLRPEELVWIENTPMQHWGLSSQILFLQGRAPRVALWSPEAAAASAETPPHLLLSPFNRFQPGVSSATWFQWEPLIAGLQDSAPAEEKRPVAPGK